MHSRRPKNQSLTITPQRVQPRNAALSGAGVLTAPLLALPKLALNNPTPDNHPRSRAASKLAPGVGEPHQALFMAHSPDSFPQNSSAGERNGSIGSQNLENTGLDNIENAEDGADSEEAALENTSVQPDAKAAAKVAFLQILQRAKEGDRNAFEEIYQLYHRRIYNAAYGMLGDPDDAQDVTQDVFIRLHDALPTLRADEAFSTYIYRIALNLCRDRARRKKRVRFQSMDTPRVGEEGDAEPMDFPDAGKLPEEKLTGDELQRRVREAVLTLSEDHKSVIVMHHFQGMEVNDIARILKVPSGTVKSRLARGRDQLHRKLKTYLGV
jgi:RNA polymerase sigma-70 factor (ECF subfamily)